MDIDINNSLEDTLKNGIPVREIVSAVLCFLTGGIIACLLIGNDLVDGEN